MSAFGFTSLLKKPKVPEVQVFTEEEPSTTSEAIAKSVSGSAATPSSNQSTSEVGLKFRLIWLGYLACLTKLS